MTATRERDLTAMSLGGVSWRAGALPARSGLPLVALCFLLSGFAALLYQTAWLRQFSIVFGTSELAVATVLAAYMAGLAAGAAIAGRWVRRVRRPVLAYGLLEAGIALSALAVPLLLAAAGGLYVWVLGGQPEPPNAAAWGQPLFYLVAGFVVLAVPTALMGATLPLLTRYAVRSDAEVGPRVALLYAINTAGAVGGTIAAAFWLLPSLGLRGTVWCGVAVNALIFAVAATLARRADVAAGAAADGGDTVRPIGFFADCVRPLLASGLSMTQARQALAEQPAWILPLMLVSGANAFYYEVLWTRMLTHVLGGSIYAFATMLAAFLGGIALGSGLAGPVAAGKTRAAYAFAAAQVAIAGLSAGVYAWMQALIPETRGTFELALYAVLVMLPATVFIGATFPLAVRIVVRDEREVGPVTARVYAWNTVGAIVGAVLAGFVLIPAVGFEGSIRLAVLVNLAIALASVVLVVPFRTVLSGSLAALIVLASIFYVPPRPTTVIEKTAFALPRSANAETLHFAVGRSATVLVSEADGSFTILTNGLPEASVLPKGAPRLAQPHQWLTALAVAARPDADAMLVIGFGGGVALEDVPATVTDIDVVELEPEVIAANRLLSERRALDPLEDPRIHVIVNDARNALRLTRKRYDLIVSQPSHPWTAGASHLFTREFVGLGKAHLDESGVFLQWMSASFVDGELLRSVAANLVDAFANVRLYQSGPALFFLASDAPLDIERVLARTGRPLSQNLLHYSYLGLNGVSDFIVALAMDEDGVRRFAEGAPLSTDDRNRVATHSRALADGLSSQALMSLFAAYDPLLKADSWIYADFGRELNFAYMAGRLLADGRGQRASALESTAPSASARALIRGLLSGAAGRQDEARRAVLDALEADPRNADARFALIQPQLAALARGAASPEIADLARDLPDAARAVVRGWTLAATRDWAALAAIDRQLAGANTTDLWFPEATQLRADWRVRVADEKRYAFDAIRMVDRALVIRPGLELLMLRAAAAGVLGDDAAFVESARAVAGQVRGRLDAEVAGTATIGEAERIRMTGSLRSLEGGLARADSRSGQAVAAAVGILLRRLDNGAL